MDIVVVVLQYVQQIEAQNWKIREGKVQRWSRLSLQTLFLLSPVDVSVEDAPEGGAQEAVDDKVDRGVDGEENVGDGGAVEGPLGCSHGAAVLQALANCILEERQRIHSIPVHISI